MTDDKVMMRCVCGCSVLVVDFDDYDLPEPRWSWEFCTSTCYEGSLRHRLRVIWNLLRGTSDYLHGTVHTVGDMRRLHALLTRTLPPTPDVIATGGEPMTIRYGKSDR